MGTTTIGPFSCGSVIFGPPTPVLWVNFTPEAVESDDLEYATATSTNSEFATQSVLLQDWGFSIPDQATNIQPTVEMLGYSTVEASVWQSSHVINTPFLQLSTTRSVTAFEGPPDVNSIASNYLFFAGRNTAANFNDPEYGILFRATNTSSDTGIYALNRIRMFLTYDLPDPTASSSLQTFVVG